MTQRLHPCLQLPPLQQERLKRPNVPSRPAMWYTAPASSFTLQNCTMKSCDTQCTHDSLAPLQLQDDFV